MTEKKDLVVVLIELFKINNDRMGIYRKAAREINEHDLKIVFQNAIEEGKKIEAVLTLEIFKRNSLPEVDATTIAGEIYMFWLEVKQFFTGKDYNSIIKSCKFSEFCVQKAYKKALMHEDISLELSQILRDQTLMLRKSHKELRSYHINKTSGSFSRINGTMVKT